jgi:hypothetical protein
MLPDDYEFDGDVAISAKLTATPSANLNIPTVDFWYEIYCPAKSSILRYSNKILYDYCLLRRPTGPPLSRAERPEVTPRRPVSASPTKPYRNRTYTEVWCYFFSSRSEGGEFRISRS